MKSTGPPPSNQVAHINCGNCRTTLMYPYGASSVKCAVCQFVTNVNVSTPFTSPWLSVQKIFTSFLNPQMSNGRVPLASNRPNGTAAPGTMPSTSTVSLSSNSLDSYGTGYLLTLFIFSSSQHHRLRHKLSS